MWAAYRAADARLRLWRRDLGAPAAGRGRAARGRPSAFDDEEEALRVEEEAALASPDDLPAVRPYVLSRLLRPGRFAPRHLDGAVAFLGGPPARAPGAASVGGGAAAAEEAAARLADAVDARLSELAARYAAQAAALMREPPAASAVESGLGLELLRLCSARKTEASELLALHPTAMTGAAPLALLTRARLSVLAPALPPLGGGADAALAAARALPAALGAAVATTLGGADAAAAAALPPLTAAAWRAALRAGDKSTALVRAVARRPRRCRRRRSRRPPPTRFATPSPCWRRRAARRRPPNGTLASAPPPTRARRARRRRRRPAARRARRRRRRAGWRRRRRTRRPTAAPSAAASSSASRRARARPAGQRPSLHGAAVGAAQLSIACDLLGWLALEAPAQGQPAAGDEETAAGSGALEATLSGLPLMGRWAAAEGGSVEEAGATLDGRPHAGALLQLVLADVRLAEAERPTAAPPATAATAAPLACVSALPRRRASVASPPWVRPSPQLGGSPPPLPPRLRPPPHW